MNHLGLLEIITKLDIAEDTSLEFKAALGQAGDGELPKSFYETYVAMANTQGGIIVLGVSEKPKGVFVATGIANPSKVMKQLWDGLNNREQVSFNLLTNEMVQIDELPPVKVIIIRVPRAYRTHRPIYKGQNVMTGTYRRNHEGDYLCDDETVKRMLTEQVEQNCDSKLLKGYKLGDIDLDSLKAYRQLFRTTKPDHPWLTQSDQEFLRSLGGWSINRDTNEEGLSLAGLLMFGKLRSILDQLPYYVLDYQERLLPKSHERWVDRVTTDGTWSGNLFDFYRVVINKLTSDLKTPFNLEKNQRIDDTPIREALREALVNTLIHADYTGRTSVLIVKRPDLFGFRNPGLMRILVSDAIQGGLSDCRNRNLQKMFQLAGLGEQAGSGIPKIWRNWSDQHWRQPQLTDHLDPDQTRLELHTVSLYPQDVLEELKERFGSRLQQFSDIQRLALATARVEGCVTHTRLHSISSLHSREITLALHSLVKEGILETGGGGRGTYYYFAGEHGNLLDDEESLPFSQPGSVPLKGNSVPSGQLGSVPLGDNSVPLQLSSALEQEINAIRIKKKVSQKEIRQVILGICENEFTTLKALAILLARKPDYLRIKHLIPLVTSKELILRYAESPHHPKQAYKTAPK